MALVFQDFKQGNFRYLFNDKKSAEKFQQINDLEEYEWVKMENKFYLIEIPQEVIQAIGGVECD